MSRLAILFVLLPAGIHNLYAQSHPLQARMDAYVEELVLRHSLPGLAVGVVKDGEVFYTRATGVRRWGHHESVSTSSLFHTASISKLITAQTVVALAREGMLDLDAPMLTYLPGLRFSQPEAAGITARHLLSHRSGLGDYRWYRWSPNRTPEDALCAPLFGRPLPVRSAPGERFRYSNLGYDVLACLVERVSSEPFEDVAQRRVMRPLGMTHSDFRYPFTPDSLRVSPHTRSRWRTSPRTRGPYPYARRYAGSSTLNASVLDLTSWMRATLYAWEQGEPSLREMMEPSHPDSPRMGLGFQRYTVAGREAVGHFGGDRGFRSYLLLFPAEGLGLVLLMHSDQAEHVRETMLHTFATWLLASGEESE